MGQPVPVDEAIVAAALTPLYVAADETDEGRAALLGAVLRTGTAFVLSAADVPGWGPDLTDISWEPWDGLPPLPFPRIWIECANPNDAGAVPFPWGDSPQEEWRAEGEWSGLWGMGIAGDENGWVVVELYDAENDLVDFVMHEPWDEEGFNVSAMRLSSDASSHYPFPTDPDELAAIAEQTGEDPSARAMGAWRAILLVQMLDVLGVRHVPLEVPRPHRRAHQRRFRVPHPSVYFVDLRQAGDAHAGKGDREYHHRWLVRGHWRQLATGKRTWVRPYIKGPAGAPWRGRPIYIDRGALTGESAQRGEAGEPQRQP